MTCLIAVDCRRQRCVTTSERTCGGVQLGQPPSEAICFEDNTSCDPWCLNFRFPLCGRCAVAPLLPSEQPYHLYDRFRYHPHVHGSSVDICATRVVEAID